MIKEYRIPLPMSVEEYRIAQLYMVAKFCREKSKPGEGVEIIKNEPFEDTEKGLKGQYTLKIIHLGSHIPAWAKAIAPASLLQVEEHSWNCYPYVKSEYKCAFFGEKFSIISETRYVDDDEGAIENIHKISEQDMKEREVEVVDIVKETVDPLHYKVEEDPTKFKSKKTGRGPYQGGWIKESKPKMCIYKIAWVKFEYWGFQTKVESYLQNKMVRDILILSHRQAICWIDEWYDMTIDDIRKYEAETKEILDNIAKKQAEAKLLENAPANNNNNNNSANPNQNSEKGWLGGWW